MHALQLGVLGPLQISVAGRVVELRRAKQRSLLALLLLNVGEIVSTDRLVEELWAGQPPKTAVGSLQNLVSELRKALGRQTFSTRAHRVTCSTSIPSSSTCTAFSASSLERARTKDAELRATQLREALALWRGPPLADLALEPFAQVEIARLEELANRRARGSDLRRARGGTPFTAGRRARGAGRRASAAGKAARSADARPVPLRPAGRGAGGLQRGARDARRTSSVSSRRRSYSGSSRRSCATIGSSSSRRSREVATASAARAAGSRKTVTILFTDIVDSTSLGARLDPEVMRSVMRRYYDTVRTIVERHGGTLEKFIGDAAMAVFGIPQLHEDDALRAVRAAGELREALAGLNADLGREHRAHHPDPHGDQHRRGDRGRYRLRPAVRSRGARSTVAMRLQQSALPGETLLGAATRTTRAGRRDDRAGRACGPRRLARPRAGLPPRGARRDQPSCNARPRPAGRQSRRSSQRLRSAFEPVRDGTSKQGRRRSSARPVSARRGSPGELVSALGSEATALLRSLRLVRGRGHLPAVGRDRPPGSAEAARRRRSRPCSRATKKRRSIAERVTELTGRSGGHGLDGRAVLGGSALLRGARAPTTAPRRPRGHPLGGADAARADRVPRRRGSRRRRCSCSVWRGRSSSRSGPGWGAQGRRSRSTRSRRTRPTRCVGELGGRRSEVSDEVTLARSSRQPKGTRSSSSNCTPM